ncbi:metallopeptidase [Patescibacteria group bacterium]|nr:metallopeptidase [Patescibacteria group bacterium]
MKLKSQKSKVKKLEWEEAKDVKIKINKILSVLDLPYINPKRIYCYRTEGSKSRAYARIWSFPKIFQHALDLEPAYVIEVLSKYYDGLDDSEQTKVLIHELLHIPKNFSGALLSHRTRGRHLGKIANTLYNEYRRLENL